MIEPGQLYDSIRGHSTSSRWEVMGIDTNRRMVILEEVGRRIGPAPDSYRQNHRNPSDRFADWPLEDINGDDWGWKEVSVETLMKGSDYVPCNQGSDTQPTLGLD